MADRLHLAPDRCGSPRSESLSDPAVLAAACGYGLATNHPYHDGNKRIAFLTKVIFLGLNGWDLETPEAEVAAIILAVAAGRCPESEFAGWHLEQPLELELAYESSSRLRR